MRVGIVGFTNMRYMPYLRYYTNALEEHGIEYELIYWDRHQLKEELPSRHYVMRTLLADATPKLSKIRPMLQYAHFVKRTVLQRDYDFLIFLTPIPAVILARFLGSKYRGRYVVDIRDYSLEGNPIYYFILSRVLRNAALRVISSPAFRSFLPAMDYVLCHNLNVPTNAPRPVSYQRKHGEVIRISYVGAIAYFDEVAKFVSAIAHDSRFTFSIYGVGMDEARLRSYFQSVGFSNVSFHGAFALGQLDEIYRATDLVFNAYGSQGVNVKCLLSNKLYQALWYKRPLIVSPNTAMAKAAGTMAFAVDYAVETLSDSLYRWYHSIEWGEFCESSTSLLEEAISDNNAFKSELLRLLL